MSKQRVSRRQFLSYTLTGVGGFMAAGMLMPMVRFAVDPVLKAEEGGDFVATKQKVADLTKDPVKVDFTFKQTSRSNVHSASSNPSRRSKASGSGARPRNFS